LEEREKEKEKMKQMFKTELQEERKLVRRKEKSKQKKIDDEKNTEEKKKKEKEDEEIVKNQKITEKEKQFETAHKKLAHVLVDNVDAAIDKHIEAHQKSRFLKRFFDKRQAKLNKHQHATQLLGRLRELLNQLRQGIGDDEFNYKELVEILRHV